MLKDFPKMLKSLEIDKWYLQRYIPSHKVKNRKNLSPSISTYERTANQLFEISKRHGIACYTKRDRRHNSVFLLTQDGRLFTQDDTVPGRKILIGDFEKVTDYFGAVSSSDHSDRYYAGVNFSNRGTK